MSQALIELKGFSATLGERLLFNIDHLAFEAGSSTTLIGATGSGKSVLLKALSGVLPAHPFKLTGGLKLYGKDAYVDGKKTGYGDWTAIRGQGLVYVPAESAQAMNPALSLEQNLKLLAPESQPLVERRLQEYFGIEFRKFARLYPDEVSGGQLQRITLMILLSRDGQLVYLDEPTVNLDRQLRKRFIEFLNAEILQKQDRTVVIASHDLDFVRGLNTDRLLRLENSRLNPLDKLPESQGYEKPQSALSSSPGFELKGVAQHYTIRGIFGEHEFYAFRDLNIAFDRSTIYGITGPSGCGKTSMIRSILRLIDGTSGSITLDGTELIGLKPWERGVDPAPFMPFRRRMTIVQQDSRYAFFPDLRVRDSLEKINKVHGVGETMDWGKVDFFMKKIGLPAHLLDSYPRSLSSGEMKRMDMVRALAAGPDVLLLDEPFAYIDFDTRSMVMKAISEYIAAHATVIIVVTHEEFDLKYFIDTNYDFLSMVDGQSARAEA